MLTQSYLKEILTYNPETGIFTWNNVHQGVKKNLTAGSLAYGYIDIMINNKIYKAHRLAWLYVHGEMPKNVIDHINRIKDDNRIENLRDVSNLINNQNRIKSSLNNKCGYLGVSKKGDKYRARIQANEKSHHLGCFETAELAHEAYLIAKRELHKGYTI